MILVLSGTADGRMVIKALREKGYRVAATTVTTYGKELIVRQEEIPVLEGGLTEGELIKLIQDQEIRMIVDATHPFAQEVSQMAMGVCNGLGLPYLRFEREGTELLRGEDNVHQVGSFREAARLVLEFEGIVFLTVGSKHLEELCNIIPLERVVARVLPMSQVLKKCEMLGLLPSQVLALQGPFSKALNKELFHGYKAGVVVTKDSGKIGGAEEKLAACQELGIPLIMVTRPHMQYPVVATTISQLLDCIMEVF